ncbi:hypothetical protein BXZ70DRAFT_934446 [Cristinia sonorae]|uniref:RING-type domain-containing protein n=1 Tax=Cristinia sonorae TaxID=1940300 RepID=A0A8K0UQM7_9AGAR|nr:hypothetical protein BXZ70DRAFT_934446 [Cristinia sonorae]
MSGQATAGPHAGLPLLSGPPPEHPDASDSSCRKCSKGLNAIFSRGRKCNHCGYTYCHTCTDYTALMPRSAGIEDHYYAAAPGPGYDIVQVCAYCVKYLNITAKSKDQLKKLSLAVLKEYAGAYHIPVNNVVEKDDLVDRLISARANGSLKPEFERYYRANSVPDQSEPRRGFFSRGGGHAGPSQQQRPGQQQPRARTASQPSSFSFARPDLEPDPPQYQPPPHPPPPPPPPPQPQSQQQPRPSSNYGYTTPPRTTQYAPRPTGFYPPPGPPPGMPHFTSRTGAAAQASANLHPNANDTPRPRSTSLPRSNQASRTTSPTPSPASNTPQPPTLDALLDMTPDQISGLSIGVLKAVLFRNHVNVGGVLEKGDLVGRVKTLVEDERVERAEAIRRAEEEEMEMWAMRERAERRERRQEEGDNGGGEDDEGDDGEGGGGSHDDEGAIAPVPPSSEEKPKPPPASASSKAHAKGLASHLERTGLCVICQDEEANIAIVDCGHMALCRACSDLVMQSTKECPLCRTRILTESRLLRIFKA